MNTDKDNQSPGRNGNNREGFPPMGTLKHGNPAGNPNNAPRCGAKAKSTGQPCQAPAMKNGKCRLHGGKSTGPRTEEGLKRSRYARWKHGDYSKRAMEIIDGYLWIDDEFIPTRAKLEEEAQERAESRARLLRRLKL